MKRFALLLVVAVCVMVTSLVSEELAGPDHALALPQQQILRPIANGYHQEWGEAFGSGGKHWELVDDVTPDDAGSYIFDNTWNGTERDTYYLQPTTITSIGSVEVVARATRVTTNDNNNVRLLLRSGSTDSQSPVETLSQNYWAEVSYSWNTDPATGQPWTQAAVNALQAGVQNAMGPSGGGGVGVTQVYVVVTEGAEILRPTANGAYTEWGELWGAGTTHWDHAEEVTADDSGSYIMDNTWNGTERDTFQLSDTNYTSIGSVQVVARAARITTNDNNNVRLFIRSGSTDSQSPVQTLSMSWSEVSYTWATDPATGQPWTQAAVNALQAGIQNAMGPSGGGGVEVTQVYAVVVDPAPPPPPCCSYGPYGAGADNQFDPHDGDSFTTWKQEGASYGFVIGAGDLSGNGYPALNINQQITDAFPALATDSPVLVYACVYPTTPSTANAIKAVVDNLASAGLFGSLNHYGGVLFIVWDIEDGVYCGNWNSVSLTTAEDDLTSDTELFVSDAWSDGLSTGVGVAWTADPYISSPYASSTTSKVALWATSNGHYGVLIPQLVGSHVPLVGSWQTADATSVQTYANDNIMFAGEPLPSTLIYPNTEDAIYSGNQQTNLCGNQNDINSMDSVNGGGVMIWYPYHAPWCFQ